jgi:TPP-dependent pyruvate/acetoin dehydrogenase alpha subunit
MDSIKKEVAVEKKGTGISRRSFMKGVGGVAAAATVLGMGMKAKAEPVPAFVTVPKETLLEMYRRMQRIRQGDSQMLKMVGEGVDKYVPGMQNWCHASVGEEATCVGVAMAMNKEDMIAGTHRSHGYPLARGLDMNTWAAEFWVKVTGSNRGHGGSMHIAEPALGILGMTGIVGAGVPIAVGAAFTAQVLKTKQVVVSTCGDGAMQSSGFNSSLNLAKIWDAPIVFVINNNQWGAGLSARWVDANMKGGKDIATRASGFNMPGITVDGNDIFAVYKAARFCIENARAGKGPSLLECVTFRHFSHMGPSPHECTRWPYNNQAELDYWLNRDPIPRFERTVLDGKLLTQTELDPIRKSVEGELAAAIDFALKSPMADPKEEYKYYVDVFKARAI